MDTIQEYRVQELSELELVELHGGWTGSDDLAQDIGRVVGGLVGAFLRVGEAFYRGGGITGGNPWLRR